MFVSDVAAKGLVRLFALTTNGSNKVNSTASSALGSANSTTEGAGASATIISTNTVGGGDAGEAVVARLGDDETLNVVTSSGANSATNTTSACAPASSI
ncbi:unnamed protein product, partial [Amoebophrya sp. A25]|eukprot:GSA25T00012203001.1